MSMMLLAMFGKRFEDVWDVLGMSEGVLAMSDVLMVCSWCF